MAGSKRQRSGFWVGGFLAAGLLLSAGCLSWFDRGTVVAPEAWVPRTNSAEPAGPVAHRPLRADDRVVVTLRTSVNTRGETVEDIVDTDGMIRLPLIGEFRVDGMTTSEASRAIAQEYIERGYYIDMLANVISTTIREGLVEEYSITGEINRRGRFPLREGMTLWEAIIAAGDMTDFASDTVLLTREGVTKSFSIDRIRRGRIQDPVIRNGDIIQVRSRIF